MTRLHFILAATLLLIPTSSLRADDTAIAAKARSDGGQVTVAIDGLGCPFCVFGLEKKLKKVTGVKAVTIELKTGIAVLALEPGVPVGTKETREALAEALKEAVKKAGFTAKKVTFNKG